MKNVQAKNTVTRHIDGIYKYEVAPDSKEIQFPQFKRHLRPFYITHVQKYGSVKTCVERQIGRRVHLRHSARKICSNHS